MRYLIYRSFVSFSPNGAYILASSLDNQIRLWDRSSGKILKKYSGHMNERFCIASQFLIIEHFDKSDTNQKEIQNNCHSLILSGSEDNCIYIWDVQAEKLILKILAHSGNTLFIVDKYCIN